MPAGHCWLFCWLFCCVIIRPRVVQLVALNVNIFFVHHYSPLLTVSLYQAVVKTVLEILVVRLTSGGRRRVPLAVISNDILIGRN